MVSMCTMVSTTQLSHQTGLVYNPNTSRTCCLAPSASQFFGFRCISSSRRHFESARFASSECSHRTLSVSFSFERPGLLTERQRRRVAVGCSGAAEEIVTEKPIELPIFPQRRTYNTGKDIFRSDAFFNGDALQRLAEILVGSSLLLATLGLGFARPALARPSTVETSSNVLTETLDSDENMISETALESETAPSESAKEEEDDPAEIVLLSYLGRHPEDVKALEGLMYVRLRKGSIAKALETVENLLALRPDHPPWQLIRAQALEFLGDLDEARRAFVLILEKDPLSARALQGLATVMSKAGEGAEMLQMLRTAVRTAMETGKMREAKNLRMLLGQMYTLEGNFQEALAQYQELEREDPKDFRPYLCQGLVYSLLDQKADADKAFRKYRRRCPKSFPERGYLDDLMIGAKTEARKIQAGERLRPQGKKKAKPLKQPNIVTAVAENCEE